MEVLSVRLRKLLLFSALLFTLSTLSAPVIFLKGDFTVEATPNTGAVILGRSILLQAYYDQPTTTKTPSSTSYSISFTSNPSSPTVGQPVSFRFAFKQGGDTARHIWYTYNIARDGTLVFTSGKGDIGGSLHTHSGDTANADPDRVAPFTFTQPGTHQVTVSITGFDIPEVALNPPFVQKFSMTATGATDATTTPTSPASRAAAPPAATVSSVDPLVIGGIATVVVIGVLAALILRRR